MIFEERTPPPRTPHVWGIAQGWQSSPASGKGITPTLAVRICTLPETEDTRGEIYVDRAVIGFDHDLPLRDILSGVETDEAVAVPKDQPQLIRALQAEGFDVSMIPTIRRSARRPLRIVIKPSISKLTDDHYQRAGDLIEQTASVDPSGGVRWI